MGRHTADFRLAMLASTTLIARWWPIIKAAGIKGE
jgi:hypothetical protein